MNKYFILAFLVVLSGCTSSAVKLTLTDLPQPVYISATDGTTYMAPSSQNPPANALSYNQIDTMVKGSNYSSDSGTSSKTLNRSPNYTPYLKRSFNNITYLPDGSSSTRYYQITYRGDSFVPNTYGFAEQIIENIPKSEFDYPDWDGLAMTKLVLGGGVTGLNYVDFGYWIGVPKNTTKQPIYQAFATKTNLYYDQTPDANKSYTGRTTAIVVDNNVGSARELGGNATLTLDSSKNAQLHLAFQNYYTFDINSYHNGSSITSVSVTGSPTDGPSFSSCATGCDAAATYKYIGQYQADEVGGTYRYKSGNSHLVGSFGATLDY